MRNRNDKQRIAENRIHDRDWKIVIEHEAPKLPAERRADLGRILQQSYTALKFCDESRP